MNLIQEASLMAGKDLRIEARSRVTIRQIIPFGLITLVLFAFALDPDRGILARVAPGLFWITILLALLLAISRAYSIESANGAGDALRLSGLDPSAIFLGKAAAIAVELALLEVVLTVGVIVLFNVSVASVGFLILAALVATIGLASIGTLYGVLASGLRVRETLVPVLLLPVAAPILLGATRAWEIGIDGSISDGWPWIGILFVSTLLFTAIGMLSFGSLLEES